MEIAKTIKPWGGIPVGIMVKVILKTKTSTIIQLENSKDRITYPTSFLEFYQGELETVKALYG